MDDALLVGSLQGVEHLKAVLGRLPERHRPSERSAVQILHNQVVWPHVVKSADVRVLKCGDSLRLPLQPGQPVRIVLHFIEQHLQGDVAMESCVASAIDCAHAPLADETTDFVHADAGAGRQCHRVQGIGG
jgi:hypothetical protein